VIKQIVDKIQSIILSFVFVLNFFAPAISAYSTETETFDPSIEFSFSDKSISASISDENSYEINSSSLKIKKSGIYKLSGSCNDGSIIVEQSASDSVLILDGLNVNSDSGLTCNGSVTVFLEGNNSFSGKSSNSPDDSAISLSKDASLTIKGNGKLDIKNHTLGISGLQDFLNNEHAPAVKIYGGNLNFVTSGASISVEDVSFLGGSFSSDSSSSIVCKDLNISGGSFDLKSDENCIDAENIKITDGNLKINAGGKGIRADYELKIGKENSNDSSSTPSIVIEKSDEGMEAAKIYIYSGKGTIKSTDDGINAANAVLGEDYPFGMEINGGEWYIDSTSGDGLDSNGSIVLNGGSVVVFGSEKNDEAAIDYETNFEVNGGKLLAVGMSNMAMLPTKGNYVFFGKKNSGFNADTPSNAGVVENQEQSDSNNQSSVSIKAGDEIVIKDSKNNVVSSTTAVRSANSVFYAVTDQNETYKLFINSNESVSSPSSSSTISNAKTKSSSTSDYWLENGATCTYVKHDYEENFLLEDSGGTRAWYGIRDPNHVLEENSVFHVQWMNSASINENEKKRYYEIYEKLDDSLKAKAKEGKLWIFDMGVRKPDGTEYGKLDKSVYVDIELGSDWSTNDLAVVCVTDSKDEKINYTVLKDPLYINHNGTLITLNKVARLTIDHFSPYALTESSTSGASGRVSTGDDSNSIIVIALELMTISALAFNILSRKKPNLI